MSFNDVHPGDPMNAVNVQQVIDALKGTVGKGVPLVVDAVNDSTRYALTLQNDDTVNSRAINVLKADGSVLIAADATGVTLGSPVNLQPNSVPGAAITNASITNAKLGPDVARANLLTNGGFEVWQRGTNFVFAANQSGRCADSWFVANPNGSGDSINISRNAGFGAGGSNFSAGVAYTRGATGGTYMQQMVRQSEVPLAGKTVSLSIDTVASALGLFSVQISSDGTGATNPTVTNSGTAQKVTLTMVVPSNSTEVNVSIIFLASGNSGFDNASLVVGTQPADYVPLHPADDLARCLRYYELLTVPASNEWIGLVQCYSATGANTAVRYKTQKVVTPTVTIVNPTGFSLQPAGGGAVATTNVTVGSASVNTAGINLAVASGLVAGNASLWSVAPGLGQIIAESNP